MAATKPPKTRAGKNPATKRSTTRPTAVKNPVARARTRPSTDATALQAFALKRDLRMDLPDLGHNNPGLVEIWRAPETHDDGDGQALNVVATNTAGLWFVLADDGSIHLVDDCERELGTKIFPDVAAFVKELARQNP